MTASRRKTRYRLKKTKKARIQAAITLAGIILILGGLLHAVISLLWPVHYLDATQSEIDGIPLYTDFLEQD